MSKNNKMKCKINKREENHGIMSTNMRAIWRFEWK
jgi:hypothetical protein